MNQFFTVFQYELKEYLKNKSFVIITLILAIAGAAILFLPRFIDLSDLTGTGGQSQAVSEIADDNGNTGTEDSSDTPAANDVSGKLCLYDEAGITDMELLKQFFPNTEWITAKNDQEVRDAVKAENADAGFVVKSGDSYDYYVYNKEMYDSNSAVFEEAMRTFYRIRYCAEHDLDYAQITQMYDTPITVHENILNKDTGSNYWYCYILVILVFMLIVLYGQMIAVSVTSEKSSRAIEVLVTSTTPNSLLFGKVIAGAIGGLVQIGIVLAAILISYQINREQWGGMLDMLLHIPASVLVTFAFFGIGGYLFYAFLYGAMGALVSKTEDISKSASGLLIIIMAVYMFSLMQLTNPDGMIMKVLSFLPVSSYSTMFARIAMGTVDTWEIIVSFLILAVSIVGAGFIGAKLYRMGTLRYGNPIKLRTALKNIRSEE